MDGVQDEYAVKYVILTQEILCDKQLNAIEKLVLARMSGFSQFFESAAATADLLGTTERVVKDAKRKLLKLGYVREKANTGRGKVYEFCPEMYIRYTKKRTSDIRKNVHQTYEKTYIENKERINKEYINSEKPKNESVKKSEYGNPQVNALLEIWDAEVGITAKRDQANRRAAYNLIRHEGFEGARRVVGLIGQSVRKGDQFAPQVASFKELWGKYGKLEKILMYGKKMDAVAAAEQHSYPYKNEETIPEIEVSDEEREKVKQMMKEARKQLFGGVK